MYAEERQHAIDRLVNESGRLSVTELAREQREEIAAAGPRLVEA